jgi:dihydrofolate reductase
MMTRATAGPGLFGALDAVGMESARAAIELGLVDELRMFRHPVVVGGGTPFLPPVSRDVALDLIETRTLGARVIYERYGRAREESD